MKVVLDTNVAVSGLLSPFGNPAEILRMISSGVLRLCLDARILSEYKDVLGRPKFQFEERKIQGLLDQIENRGHIVASTPLPQTLQDRTDEPFLEVAVTGRVDALITGNIAHFPAHLRCGIRVLAPTKFLEFYRKQMRNT